MKSNLPERGAAGEPIRPRCAVLESPSRARADAIRQFHEWGDDGMVEMLADLEADELLREQVVLILRSLETARE